MFHSIEFLLATFSLCKIFSADFDSDLGISFIRCAFRSLPGVRSLLLRCRRLDSIVFVTNQYKKRGSEDGVKRVIPKRKLLIALSPL